MKDKTDSLSFTIVTSSETELSDVRIALGEIADKAGANVQDESEASALQRRGMVELVDIASWVISGGASLSAGVIGNYFYDWLKARVGEPVVTEYKKHEDRYIEIVNPETGLRITIRERVIETTNRSLE